MQILLAFHLLGVVLWMGGLLQLSRILGYHALEHPTVRPRYSWLEGRLNYLVTIPGAVITLGTGIAQLALSEPAYLRAAAWLRYKLVLVIVVAVLHVVLTRKQRALARGPADAKIRKAPFAAIHGTLGLLLIAVLLLAMLKPMG